MEFRSVAAFLSMCGRRCIIMVRGGRTFRPKDGVYVRNSDGSKEKSSGSHRKNAQESLRFISLGGLGEIGKNMYLIEYGDEILVIDSGLKFPDEEMLGIDFVIPDISYLAENKSRIVGAIITHGHEDHTGALAFVLPKLDIPIYATKLTLAMIEHKLREAAPSYVVKANEVRAGDSITLGNFFIRFMAVCHSIPDGVGIAVKTPLGTVVHTGDFKLDPTPIDGRLTDYGMFADIGREGVLLMLSDSTNVERKGFTPSERVLGGTLERIFRLHRNRRIVIATFASNLHRVQQVADVASRFNRKIAFIGRSMTGNVELAQELEYLDIDPKMIVPMEEIERTAPNQLVVMTTGSQGEPFSGLVLMSKGEHRQISLGERDLVALFATPIPGNEKLVSSTINRLFARGCEVMYESDKEVHVSGHASREELKLMLNLVRPKYFVPIHGEYRHLVRHAQLAEEVGVPARNTFVMHIGDVLTITEKKAQVRDRVQAGGILVDGIAFGELEGSILKERRELAEDGVIALSATLDESGALVADPVVESRGFLHMEDAETLRSEIVAAVRQGVAEMRALGGLQSDALSQKVKMKVRDVIRRYSRSRPVIMAMVSSPRDEGSEPVFIRGRRRR